ncbi:LysM peptidoglycan-binding domain-containing protein [Myxococcota bacterium]
MNARRPYLLLLIGFLAGILSARQALAIKYKPKPEETLSHISLIHYGDPKKFVYIAAANFIADPDKVPRGKALWVPTVWRYRLKKGDSLSKLATKHLKDSKRADFLKWLNKIKNPRDLNPGDLITIPFLLRHRAQQGQSMVDVAKRYYFRTKETGLLRRFNGKRTNVLKPGEIIFVPVFDEQSAYDKVKERMKRYQEREAKVADEALEIAKKAIANGGETTTGTTTDAATRILESDAADDKQTPPEDLALIRKADELYRDGEYALAQANLARALEKNMLSSAHEAQAREIMAFCLVAMERPKDAEHEFVRLLMVDPKRTLDPVTTSPKIMEVFQRAAKGAR